MLKIIIVISFMTSILVKIVRTHDIADNNDNKIDMYKQDLYGRMMGHNKIYRVS